MVKLPEFARAFFPEGQAFNEEQGEKLARWAEGTVLPKPSELLERYATAADEATLGALERDRAAMWPKLSREQKEPLKEASDAAIARVRAERAAAERDPAALSDEEEARMSREEAEERAAIAAEGKATDG
jgi:hypothetical protein